MTTTRRNSRQRTLVYQVVKDSHSHPNAEEVYLLVRRQLPDISLGTVYRNLNLLADIGEAIKICWWKWVCCTGFTPAWAPIDSMPW